MKNNLTIPVIGGLSLALLVSSFAFAERQEKKNVRHIKLTKIENGKKMELDTVLTGDNVFVWNGDTINPEKKIKGFSPSEFDKNHPVDVEKGKQQRRIYKQLGGKDGERLKMRLDSGEDVEIITQEGDTTGQKIIIHKRMKNGQDNDHLIYLDSPGHGQFPPMPPMPPMAHLKRFRGMHSANTIDLNDPNIISFKKKKMSGDREKIEIIRKKTSKADNEDFNMNFNMDMDQAIEVPEPPMPPEIDIDINDEDQGNLPEQKKEVEKKIEVQPSKEK